MHACSVQRHDIIATPWGNGVNRKIAPIVRWFMRLFTLHRMFVKFHAAFIIIITSSRTILRESGTLAHCFVQRVLFITIHRKLFPCCNRHNRAGSTLQQLVHTDHEASCSDSSLKLAIHSIRGTPSPQL